MCMGLASGYREPKEKLTVIRCEKCGRSWQVTEAAAKHYNEYYKGICADCRSGEEKKQSLLNRYTNCENCPMRLKWRKRKWECVAAKYIAKYIEIKNIVKSLTQRVHIKSVIAGTQGHCVK